MESGYLLEIVDLIRKDTMDVMFQLKKVNLSLEKLILCVEKMKGSADNGEAVDEG